MPNFDISILTDRKCGDILTGNTGVFSSPSHPNNYPSNTVCLWQINVPNAKKIIVEFPRFYLGVEGIPNCNKDYMLFLKDGKFPSAYAATKKCGTDSSPLIFEGDKAWIEFVTDKTGNYPGFNAKYEAVFDSPPATEQPVVTTRKTTSKIFMKIFTSFSVGPA